MPVTSTIASGVIKIALDGWSAVQAQLSALRAVAKDVTKQASDGFAKLNTSVNSLGSVFGQASSAVRGFASIADPRGALELELAFTRLQIAIGRFFIPILREAGQQINRLAAYINSLSDGTREQVLHFTKLGLAVTGVASGLGIFTGVIARVLAFVGPLVSGLSTVASLFWRVLGFLGPWGRLAVVIGSVVAVLAGLKEAGGSVQQFLANVATYAKAAWEGLQKLFSQLLAAVAPILSQLEKAWDNFVEFLEHAFAGVVPVLVAYGRLLGEFWSRAFQLLGKVIASLQPILGTLGDSFAKLFNAESGDKLHAVFLGIASAIEAAIPIVHQFFDTIESLVSADLFAGWGEQLRPVLTLFAAIDQAVTTVSAAMRSFGGNVFAGLSAQFEKIQPQLERFGALFKEVFDFISSKGGEVANALGAIGERVGPPLMALFSRIGTLVERTFDLTSAFVNLVGNSLAKGFERLSVIVGPVLDFIGDKLQVILDKLANGFENAWQPIKAGIVRLAEWFLWLSHRIEEYFLIAVNFVQNIINRLIDGVNSLIDKLNKINPGENIGNIGNVEFGGNAANADQQINQLREMKEAVKAEAKKPEAPKPVQVQFPIPVVNRLLDEFKKPAEGNQGNRFAGELVGNARFIGIAEAMRQAQSSTVPTRESVALEEILRQNVQANQNLGKIAENTGKQPNLGLAR